MIRGTTGGRSRGVLLSRVLLGRILLGGGLSALLAGRSRGGRNILRGGVLCTTVLGAGVSRAVLSATLAGGGRRVLCTTVLGAGVSRAVLRAGIRTASRGTTRVSVGARTGVGTRTGVSRRGAVIGHRRRVGRGGLRARGMHRLRRHRRIVLLRRNHRPALRLFVVLGVEGRDVLRLGVLERLGRIGGLFHHQTVLLRHRAGPRVLRAARNRLLLGQTVGPAAVHKPVRARCVEGA